MRAETARGSVDARGHQKFLMIREGTFGDARVPDISSSCVMPC
jgi:hypothetical protein